MLKATLARLRQGYRTMAYPAQPPTLQDRFRGLPSTHWEKCGVGCHACVDACPADAIELKNGSGRIDLGRCLFCTDCVEVCTTDAITFTNDHRLATRKRDDLWFEHETLTLAAALEEKTRRIFGRSLKLREVSAGGCNGCEADANVLTTIGWDIGRFGIQFVASPRHADGLFITGPVPKNMELALKKTYDAVPAPKIVIASGACAIAGGPFRGLREVLDGAESVVPVDLYIPGCPPHPITVLDGLLRLLGRLEEKKRS